MDLGALSAGFEKCGKKKKHRKKSGLFFYVELKNRGYKYIYYDKQPNRITGSKI